jgi:hypothetical protein
MEVTMTRLGSRAGRGTAIARVAGDLAAQAELTFVLVDG